MSITNEITRWPLSWPASWKRTAPRDRKRAEFQTHTSTRQPEGNRTTISKRVSTNDSLERLIDQLTRLGVANRDDIVISTNVKTRLDGLPYSNQTEPDDPGVAVYWRLPKGGKTQSMAIDIYDRVADNIAAVALTLAYMRGIERHGGAEILERIFLGFQALPPPINAGRPWWQVLEISQNGEPSSVSLDDAMDAYRRLAKTAHPDKGGNADQMAELNEAIRQAREVLL